MIGVTNIPGSINKFNIENGKIETYAVIGSIPKNTFVELTQKSSSDYTLAIKKATSSTTKIFGLTAANCNEQLPGRVWVLNI